MTLLENLTQKALERLDVPSELLDSCSDTFKQQLKNAISISDFILESLQHDAELLPWLIEHFDDTERSSLYSAELTEKLAQCQDENALMRELRKFRRREMVWIAWQDIHSQLPLKQSLEHLSLLAENIIMRAYYWLYDFCCQQWGVPQNEQGQAQPMLILGMGKLGGKELNFSSDIDLIFTYAENGETAGVRRTLSNAKFFTRLGQRLIKALDQQTYDGFCYRVDMRLRPFGESGPLAISFNAIEDYYQEQGREWERYAMIKARVMGKENFDCYQTLRQMLRPFVFRRYIDFSAIESLRRMKSMISTEVRRRGLTNNIKLGAGGIREIEFIAQSFQLIRGGREPSLRGRGIFETMDAIKTLGLMPVQDVDDLMSAYVYLRRLENILQAIDDKQTQTLPDNERDQARLVFAMQEQSWSSLLESVNAHMKLVHSIFESVVGDEEDKEQNLEAIYFELWNMANRDPEIVQGILSELEISDSDRFATALIEFKAELEKRTIGPRGREIINHLLPLILSHIVKREDAVSLLASIGNLITKIATRTAYLELLMAHPQAIEQLIRLCSASAMISEKLATYPILLDELLDPNQLYQPTPISEYRMQLGEYLARIPEDDMEQQMEALRQFKQTQLLRIAAADIAGVLPLMKVSDHLTALAEAILNAVINQAWYQIKIKHGEPNYLNASAEKGFAVIGYGKMGGEELGYNSDLDIVFLHDCPDQDMTDGKKLISSRQFYIKFAQRIVHLFSSRTASGILYEVDMRLRPSGASGLITSTVGAFAEYQDSEAWTWEHQALVRARVVYGEDDLADKFNQVRKQILSKTRNKEILKKEVVDMRYKMREHLGSSDDSVFNIKQDQGGIADIEFLAQYLVLANANAHPQLTADADNVSIFKNAANVGLLSQDESRALQHAYTTLRDQIHRLNLLGKKTNLESDELLDERNVVIKAWQDYLALEVMS